VRELTPVRKKKHRVMRILKHRHENRSCDWVFCDWVFPNVARATLRDPDNTRARMRDVIAGTDWTGLHPHAFRQLVATRLDSAGLSAHEIANYLPHERISMTHDDYMDRHVAGSAYQRRCLRSCRPTWANEMSNGRADLAHDR